MQFSLNPGENRVKMVFFTCNACGESLKKAQVEKHVNICRNCQVLSCIDCGKDFWGDDYQNHVKCISEDQKYGGKGFEAKANKGDVKQQQWIQKVHEALNKPDLSPSLRSVLKQVCSYDNVPRKKSKLQNWMKNSLKISNSSLQEQVWDILSAAEASEALQPCLDKVESVTNEQQEKSEKKLNKRERKEARRKNGHRTDTTQDTKTSAEGGEEEEVQRRKEKKRKHRETHEQQNGSKKSKTEEQSTEDDHTQEQQEQKAPDGKFNWKGNIKAVLREAPDHELCVKKLRKKVLSAYYSFTGDRNYKSEEDILALFNKKIQKNCSFRVLKDRVKLIQ